MRFYKIVVIKTNTNMANICISPHKTKYNCCWMVAHKEAAGTSWTSFGFWRLVGQKETLEGVTLGPGKWSCLEGNPRFVRFSWAVLKYSHLAVYGVKICGSVHSFVLLVKPAVEHLSVLEDLWWQFSLISFMDAQYVFVFLADTK